MLRFAGFQLDRQRVELRGPDGDVIRLRPKAFDMLSLLAANAGRALSKQELMDAVWPNIHVGDDSLFQCIRELRTALGDERRQLIKLVSGHGYLFDVEVITETAGNVDAARPESAEGFVHVTALPASTVWSRFAARGPMAFAAVASLGAILGLAIAAPIFGPNLIFTRPAPTIAVMPIVDAANDSDVAEMAANVTGRLTDGLAKIDNVRVIAPQWSATASAAKPVSAPAAPADFVVTGELSKTERAWTLQTRMTRTGTQEVQPMASITVDIKDTDLQLQQSRLVAGIGHQLALRINTMLNVPARPSNGDGGLPSHGAKAAIEQATASIMQTTRDRFAAAQTMLEKALADDPDNVDLQVALAALQLRGVQMVWYTPEDSAAAETKAKSLLERAVRTRPNSIPALEAYCRFLNATNEFVESLVACAKILAFDPWDGMALFHMGVAHIQLGRFEDAVETFKQADRFDTPQVSRWTWPLGAGWAYVMLGRDAEALPWLERSIAITPASGRPLMLLAVAYHRLGRTEDAKVALAAALKVRPGSTVKNIALPAKNASAAFMESRVRIEKALIEIGLPEQ